MCIRDRKLVFATNNQHKLDEVRKITAGYAEIISLSDIDCHDDIPETADTLEAVSYTHLDVYKRQILIWRKCME